MLYQLSYSGAAANGTVRFVCHSDNIEHPKDIGDRTTLAVMAAFQSLGYGLYQPFGENTRCDLVVDRGGRLTRVQCKTGRLRDGAVVFALCSNYGHHRNPQTYRRDYQGQVDAFAVFCPETEVVYLIPIDDLPGRTRAYLRVDPPLNNQAIGVHHAANYAIARVAIEGLLASSGA